MSDTYTSVLESLLPDDWETYRFDVWVGAHPKDADAGPAQGFKIHVSSIPQCAPQVLRLVVPECLATGTPFKMAGDPDMLALLLSKRYGRGGAGKFMTIYPEDETAFKHLIQRLHAVTKDEDVVGPYILSDRRYADSRVLYYRYGGFTGQSHLQADGTRKHVLVAPDGSFQEDVRTPYFSLPTWVPDPFGETVTLEAPSSAMLHDRYRIDAVLTFSNTGGVYKAVDTATGQNVVVKEARPYTNIWSEGDTLYDATKMLEREYVVMQRLADLEAVPDVVDFFQEWEHTFLVEEEVPGSTLHAFWGRSDMLLAPYIDRPGRLGTFMPVFHRVASSMIDLVEAVHERNVLLGDLSPLNVLIDNGTYEIHLIDFESASLPGDDGDALAYSMAWSTAGFLNPERVHRGRLDWKDDYYALGMLLYSFAIPVESLFDVAPDAQARFMDGFIGLGLPVEVRDVVDSLLTADVDRARAVLSAWPS